MNATDNIATDLFYKVRSRFRGLKLGSEDGTITINPNEARFFDFDYMDGERPIGHVSISLAEPNSMKVYFSSDITEAMDQGQKTNWYGFLKELRQFAKRRLMAFDTRDITKDNLDERDYAFLSQNALQQKNNNDDTTMTQPANTTPVGESQMNESTMYGTKTMSFQKLMDTRLIIKHSQALVDDTQPGARTRHISSLFVENQDGERFKYPFIHLSGARAMQRHVANGGLPYDDVGKSIIEMSEQIAQLKSFNNYVVRNDLMNSSTNNIVERSSTALNHLREQLKRMSKQSHYESYIENFQAEAMPEVPQEVVEDFTEKFTVRNFKEDIKSVFPVLYKLMQENDNTVDYDDIVEMTTEEEDVQEDATSSYDPFGQFEEWAMTLGERSAVQDPEQQDAAVRELNELMDQEFPAGVDGTNAIESLAGIIDDPALHKEIEQAAKDDPGVDARVMVKQWLENNAPEIMDQIEFGDMREDEDGAKKSDVPAALRKAKGNNDWRVSTQDLEKEKERNISSKEWLKKQQVEGDKDTDDDAPFDADDEPMSDKDEYGNTVKHKARHLAKKGMRQAVDTKELAEFINSFYDKETGTFPKGPEGVATMVGKKFGERAEQAARKMVERMAPEQSQPALQELGRMRELAGMQTEQVSQFKKGDRVVFKGKDEEYEIAGLAGQGDDPNTVYIRKPGATPTQGAMANSLELAKGAQGSQAAANQFNKGDTVEYMGKQYVVHAVDAGDPNTLYLQVPGETRTKAVWAGGGDVKATESSKMSRIKELSGMQTNEGPGSFEDILADMPKDVEQFKRTGDMSDDLYQTAYDYMFQKGIHGGRGDPYEQVADFVSDYIDVDESAGKSMTEERAEFWSEQLAKKVFDINPNLSTSGRAEELIGLGMKVSSEEIGRKETSSWFNYDEDFSSDFVSAYSYLQDSQGESESVQTEEPVPELEDIKRLSGISQGLGM